MTYYHGTSNAFYVSPVGEDMAYGKSGTFFPGIAVAVLAIAVCTGCTTSPVEQVAEAPGRSGQPAATGSFPNLNVPRHAATTQFSDEEAQGKLAQLSALQRRQNPGGASAAAAAEAERRRLKVAADEQAETLRVIEGQ